MSTVSSVLGIVTICGLIGIALFLAWLSRDDTH